MDLQNNTAFTNEMEEIFEIGIDHKKYSVSEIEDAKVTLTYINHIINIQTGIILKQADFDCDFSFGNFNFRKYLLTKKKNKIHQRINFCYNDWSSCWDDYQYFLR